MQKWQHGALRFMVGKNDFLTSRTMGLVSVRACSALGQACIPGTADRQPSLFVPRGYYVDARQEKR